MRDKGESPVCPFCGYSENTPPVASHYLIPGTMLAGKYLVGKGLGHGGFGVTYLAYDMVLGIKLAIKEYLPQDCASRVPGQKNVTPFSGEGAKRFQMGLESFLQEARNLARLDGQPGVVGVRDFFTENNTAYLVMNYLEGITLKDVLVGRKGQPMPYDQVLGIMLPVMNALERVHAIGLLHRDVSPDNIFLTRQGQAVLIDFGAARQSMGAQTSVSVILKPGYAPAEQYTSHGKQGPWTDVYALGASMYRALTGIIPPEALERTPTDKLIPPSRLGIQMPRYAEEALLRAMAVPAQARFQSVAEFRAALTGGGHTKYAKPIDSNKTPPVPKPAGVQKQNGRQPNMQDKNSYPLRAKKKKKSPAAGILIAILVLCLLAALVFGVIFVLQRVLGNPDTTQQPDMNQEQVLPSPNGEAQNLSEDTETTPVAGEQTPAAGAETPAPQVTPDPNYTGPESMRPGAAPTQALSAFVPKAYCYLGYVEGEISEGWLVGLQPDSRPDVLAACFNYDKELGEPYGDVHIYFLDAAGNLCYGGVDEGKYPILLPASCAVGMKFDGVYGASEIAAVNYSETVAGIALKDAVVVKSGDGYRFYQADKGLVLQTEKLDSKTPILYLDEDEQVKAEQFENFVMR